MHTSTDLDERIAHAHGKFYAGGGAHVANKRRLDHSIDVPTYTISMASFGIDYIIYGFGLELIDENESEDVAIYLATCGCSIRRRSE